MLSGVVLCFSTRESELIVIEVDSSHFLLLIFLHCACDHQELEPCMTVNTICDLMDDSPRKGGPQISPQTSGWLCDQCILACKAFAHEFATLTFVNVPSLVLVVLRAEDLKIRFCHQHGSCRSKVLHRVCHTCPIRERTRLICPLCQCLMIKRLQAMKLRSSIRDPAARRTDDKSGMERALRQLSLARGNRTFGKSHHSESFPCCAPEFETATTRRNPAGSALSLGASPEP